MSDLSLIDSTSDWSELFPVVDRPVWLNHAAIAPWPNAVIDAMRHYVEHNARLGPTDYDLWLATEQRLRSRLAELIQAQSSDDIALLKNTSDGLNLIANGIDWKPGDAVICCAGDFPSNVLPWQNLRRRGVEVREIQISDAAGIPSVDPEADLIAALDDRVRLMAVSAVRYDSGHRLDIERLGNACHQNGSLFAVDAIQQLGALPINVSQLAVDFVVAGSHKWLMSPEGLAVFWSSPAARAQITSDQVGWRMWPDPFNFARTDWRPPSSARQFEPGTLNMAGIHGLDAAVGLLLELKTEKTGALLLAKAAYLIEQLQRISGVVVITPSGAHQHAGIVSFKHRSVSSARIFTELSNNGVHSARRGAWVRLSPNFYTPQAQLDFSLEIIRRRCDR